MGKIATINIIGAIGSDNHSENSLKSVMHQVASNPDATEYIVNINSQGGEVTEGFAIYNYLLGLNKPITTRGVGLVASIASVIFLAGGKRELYGNTQFLIHNPWTYGEGDAAALEKKAEELRNIETQLINFYSEQTGVDAETLQALMNEDKLISADMAQELKFATEILQPIKAYAILKNKTENKNTMSKIGKIFKDAFKALKENGVVLNDMVTTTDGTELEIEMAGSSPAVGDMVMVNGEPAEGTFELADGTTIVCVGGAITEVQKPSAEAETESNEIDARIAELENKISALENENNTLKAENAEMVAEVEVITNHLKTLKVNARIPVTAPTFNKQKPNANAEMSKEEIKARFDELRAKTNKKTTIAI